jgi:dihydroneopterin aldolase
VGRTEGVGPLNTDKIALQGMLFYAHHGNSSEERSLGQRFSVDLEVEVDLRRAGHSDDLRDTVSYTHLYRAVREIMEGPSRNLLEALAEEIAARLLADFPVEAARVRVVKLSPPIPGAALTAWVEVSRHRDSS